jgi:hypothetical protein
MMQFSKKEPDKLPNIGIQKSQPRVFASRSLNENKFLFLRCKYKIYCYYPAVLGDKILSIVCNTVRKNLQMGLFV